MDLTSLKVDNKRTQMEMTHMEMTNSTPRSYVRGAVICSLAMCFYIYEFTIRTMPSAMTQELMADFHITAAGLGVLASLFYYGYTIMQLPVGLFIDHFKARLLLTVAMAGTTIGTALFGLSNSIYMADVAFFIVGFFSSFAFIGALVMISRWFPPRYFALLAGIAQATGCVGAIIGQAPIAMIVEHSSWRDAVYWFVIVGVLLTLLMWLLIKEAPSHANPHQTTHHEIEKKHLRRVCSNPQTWWIGLFSFSSWAPIILFAGLWGIPFLMGLYQTDAKTAAFGIALIWVGIAVGSPFMGWFSNLIGYRKPLLVLCGVIGLVSSIGVIYIPGINWAGMCVLLFFFGIAASGQSLSFAVVQDINPPSVAGTAIGFNNMAVIIGGIFLQPAVGLLLKHLWHGQVVHNAPVYSLSNYRFALLAIPLCGLIGIIVAWFRIKETRCTLQYDFVQRNSHAQNQ